MTITVKTLTKANFNKTLAELLPLQNTAEAFPYSCALNNDNFIISESFPIQEVATTTQSLGLTNNNNTIELVVFADLSMHHLNRLVDHCELEITALAAINNRNNQISYRFFVNTKNLESAKQRLVQFNLEENIESIIIKDAPKLNEPGLVLMDMDSTTIKIECIDELAKLAGVGEQVAEVTELAMQGKLDFTQSLYERVNTLAGSPVEILERVKKDLPLMEGLETLVAVLQQHQWRVAIASGGFTYFADHLKENLKLDAAVANTLEIENGTLTGKVLGQVIDAQVKADTLVALAEKFTIEKQQTVAMGDGANDLVMMNEAGLGVAFHAKKLVVDKADVGINAQGLDCLLHWLA